MKDKIKKINKAYKEIHNHRSAYYTKERISQGKGTSLSPLAIYPSYDH